MSSGFTVPTQSLEVVVTCADGRVFEGHVFMPATASRHTGPMRAEEWMNESTLFFPFMPNTGQPMLLNKREVLVLTVAAEADRDDLPEEAHRPAKVTIECEAQRLSGFLLVDMPANKSRVVDVMNRPETFVTLRDGNRDHLIQKERITRVIQEREG